MATARVLDASLSDKPSVSLTEYFAVLEDPDRNLTLADLQRPDVASRFKSDQAPATALSLGYSRSTFWFRLAVANPSDQAVQKILEIGHPRLSHVEFFQPGSGGVYQSVVTGNAAPFASRVYPSRFFVFPIALPAQSKQVFYIRIESTNSILVPGRLWSTEAFHSYERDDYLAQSWYFGMVSAMVLFNLLLFFAMRDRIYLLYVGFVVGTGVSLASINGLSSEFLWPGASWWSDISYYVAAAFTIAVLLLFVRRMLDTARLIPRYDQLLKWVIGAHLVAPIFYALSLQTFSKAAALLNLLTVLLIFGAGLWCALKRERSAYFFLAAFVALVIGGVVTALRSLGALPTNVFTVYGMQAGSALEMILLAFALADRFNTLRKERVTAQNMALAAEQRLVETLRTSERMLETKVNERTSELTATIAHLNQTQAALVQTEKLASLGSLVTGVAHELNTPIGNALTAASTLESAAINLRASVFSGELRKSTLTQFVDNVVPIAELVVRSCQRAADLINSFKQVAVDQTSEQRRRFNLRVLVNDNIAALRTGFTQKPWLIEVDIPHSIECDSYPGPLGQIITNLVNNANAHAFSEGQHGTLRISALVKDRSVEMHISDDGQGMAPTVLARVFEPFFTTRLGQGGSGLGLSISQNIATGVLGGSLMATSALGQGTTFHLSFPLEATI